MYRKTEYKSKDARIHQLQQSMELMLEYISYKTEANQEENIKTLGLYGFHCYIQGQIVILDARNNKTFDKLYTQRMSETGMDEDDDEE